MSEALLVKTPQGYLAPSDEEAAERLKKVKVGAIVRCDIKQMRNYDFHKKFFALVKFLFDIWEETMPRAEYRGRPILPNIDKFRRDLVILTGRYTATYNVRGDVQLEADSISFASMSQAEFEQLYSDVINVALAKVLDRPDLSEEKLRQHLDAIMHFD